MRGAVAAAVVVGALLVPATGVQASTAVGLGMREWSITVYRASVKAGTVRFLVTNRGEDAHNLRVRGPHGFRSHVSADAAPGGGHVALTARLRHPGRYVLLCVKPGHEKRGMRATLRVIEP